MQFEDVLAKMREFLWIKINIHWDDDEEGEYEYMLGQLYQDDEKVDAEEVFDGTSIYDYSLEYYNGQPLLNLWVSKEDVEDNDDGEY